MSSDREKLEYIAARLPSLELRRDEPLSAHTSFRIGGPAEGMAFPKNAAELAALLRAAKECGLYPRLLGAGTNVLAPDEGVRGLVICTKDCLLGLADLGGGKISAMAGETMAKAAVFARDLGLTGLEFAHGIPGTVGGGTYMNAGAYGGEISGAAVKTRVLMPGGTERWVSGPEQGFSYRMSAFEKAECVIVETVFQLRPGDPDEIRQTMQTLLQKRRASQPLELPSAGSTFKRPAGGYAAALIEAAGLKGWGVGDARVSEKHAGFVVNLGAATAKDVLAAMEMIQKRVFETSGIQLQPEVRIWQVE
jgi:UDP-N-acetylmuramate dehydrogenase